MLFSSAPDQGIDEKEVSKNSYLPVISPQSTSYRSGGGRPATLMGIRAGDLARTIAPALP